VLECCVIRDVSWFVSAVVSCAGYLYLCYTFQTSLGGSSSLSLILASARMELPFLDVEMTRTFWWTRVVSIKQQERSTRIVTWPILTNNDLRVKSVATMTYFVIQVFISLSPWT